MLKVDVKKEELVNYPRKAYSGPLLYAKTEDDFDDLWPEFVSKSSVFGTDTETKPNFKRGQSNATALVQLYNGHEVLIVRLQKGVLPQALSDFYANPSFVKLGIATNDDMKELRASNPGFVAKNVLDLGKMATQKGLLCTGAKRLTALLLGFTISKSQQTSNWENETLSSAQLSYAATDAWICTLIHQKLLEL